MLSAVSVRVATRTIFRSSSDGSAATFVSVEPVVMMFDEDGCFSPLAAPSEAVLLEGFPFWPPVLFVAAGRLPPQATTNARSAARAARTSHRQFGEWVCGAIVPP